MLYTGEFSNKNGDKFKVEMRVGSTTVLHNLTMGGSPCVIEMKSSGLFSPIKSRSATFEIVSDDYIFDLYTPLSRGVSVKLFDSENNILFNGYLTPNVYDQTYTYLDTITLEAVDAISTLKEFDYNYEEYPKYKSVSSILVSLVQECGYTGSLFISNCYEKINDVTLTDITSHMYVTEANFIDDDEAATHWDKYTVIEEILRYLGLTLIIDGNDIYIYNYRTQNLDLDTYTQYDLSTGLKVSDSYEVDDQIITVEQYAPGTSNLSLDAVYNKIEVSDNLYEISDIAPDIFDENMHVSITEERNMGSAGVKWTKQSVKKHWLRADEVSTDIIGYQYQTICRLKEESNWKHRYYKHSNNRELFDYYDTTSVSQYTVNPINKYCNTHGCLIQHYSFVENNGPNILPTSLSWEDYLTFFVTDDTTPSFYLSSITNFELPVLEYTVNEDIMYKPSSGTSWITIKGDLYYQYNNAKYGEKDKETLKIINTDSKLYITAPVEKTVDISSQKYCSVYRTYSNNNSEYGKGFKLWKFKVQVGDKYWNGTQWTTTDSTFYVSYNNNPKNREDEYMAAFAWMSPVPNTDYTDKVGENAYCIPIAANDPNAPSFGKVKITIYTPLLLGLELMQLWTQYFGNVAVTWADLCPVIYCKDFSIDYVYTDSQIWYSQKKDKYDSDVVYKNIINDSYTNEFDNIELKVNSVYQERPISRSYVCTDIGYINTMKHRVGDEGKTQEKNIIDLWYYHFKDPKVKYSCNIHSFPKPQDIYIFKSSDPINESYDSTKEGFLVDGYSYDIQKDNARIDFVLY